MRRLLLITAVFCFLILGAMSAQSAVFTYQPVPHDLQDLDHYAAYTWGIQWTHGSEITGAQLTFKNIYDWKVEEDFLYMHLLDLGASDLGVTRYEDVFDGDYFAGQGTLIGVWSDPVGGGPGVDLTFTFDAATLATMNQYASDGYLGFGFDPDCHYYNGGIELSLNTPVPEPATMILFGLGVLGVGLRKRFRK